MIGVVPARGGSKGLRHKNLLTVDGVPLVINAANALREFLHRVIVCTEDPQIASVARLHGYEVLDRPTDLAEDHVSIDALMGWVMGQLHATIIMHQPTVYSPSLAYLESFIKAEKNQAGWGVAVIPAGHILWKSPQDSPDRRQRQDQPEWPASEIGLRWYGDQWQGSYPQAIQVDDRWPIFDIDTPYDLDAARRSSMRKGRVAMRYVESEQFGQGHRRRIEAIADELQHLDVVSGDVHPQDEPVGSAVIVNDRLDCSEWAMLKLKDTGASVITIEDLGPGRRHADAVINALYDRSHAQYAVLRPEFRSLPPFEVKDSIESILVTFGGTDPSHYTETVLNYFRKHSNVFTRVVVPPGRNVPEYANINRLTTLSDPNMAEEMARADLVITSAGRTIFEAAAVGVPVLCAAQNLREARHAHLGPASGNIFMGLGLDMEVVSRNVNLLQSQRLRAEMSEAGRKLTDGRGAERIARIVEDLL